jgi:peptidoglycan hydrolase-like amidase
VAAALAVATGVAASCRSIPGRSPGAAAPRPDGNAVVQAATLAAVSPPAIRVGILTDVPRASVGADWGVIVKGAAADGSAVNVTVQRATFLPATPGAAGTLRLLETGQDFASAALFPANADQDLAVDGLAYRGLLEVRPTATGGLAVINVVNLEDYLRGVVPNELSPQSFPQLEALKAQAVAARTYALRNRGQFAASGYDICATPACQVYRGRASEHPLTDQAVEETRGVIASYRGNLINALYTSTCGGHTEDAVNIFEGEHEVPYLTGVACLPERSAWDIVRTAAPPKGFGEGDRGLNRDAALLIALGILDPGSYSAAALEGPATDQELRHWVAALAGALRREGCEAAAEGPVSRRGAFFHHLVTGLCWDKRQKLLAPEDTSYLLQVEDRGELLGEGETLAAALLMQEGIVSPHSDNTLRPSAPVERAEAVSILARAALRAGPPDLLSGEFRSASAAGLAVQRGEALETHALAPDVRLFRSLDGSVQAPSELILEAGEKVRFVLHDGRVSFLEVQQSLMGASADRDSRYYRWEVRMTPGEIASAAARYGTVGAVRDVVPLRLGVSGRVVEMAIRGSDGEMVIKGLKVRWALGLRENLFVVDREMDGAGGVGRFIFTGKGWGHGVGLCQVGAAGMAQAGSRFESILTHYYTGVRLGLAR